MAAPVVRHQILDGKYRVVRIIAEGGMGVLVEAVHLALEQRVALKFPLVVAGMDEDEARSRLRREARAAAKLKGEHVCRIFDVCELESGDPYLVMELLEGADLGARLGRQMAVREAAELVRQACLGVGEAHARGIVHRDLKPENLFVTVDHLGRPSVKVLDFGISKVRSDGQGTRGGATTRRAMGSPLYMSPEQMLATSDVDARADVWSLGIILYELVSGVGPFDAPSIPQICVRVMREAPLPLLDLRSDIPEAFAALVHRCLDKDPRGRAVDAAKLAFQLAPFARGEVEAPKHGRASTAPSSVDVRPTAAGIALEHVKPRRRRGRIAGAIAAAAVIALGVFTLVRLPDAARIVRTSAAGPAAAQEPEAPTAPATPSALALTASASPSEPPPPDATACAPATPTAAPTATARRTPTSTKRTPRPLRNYVAPSGPELDDAGVDVRPTDAPDIYEARPASAEEAARPAE